MNLSPCFTPKKIYNETIEEYISVPCGHCSACRTAKSYDFKTRLILEKSYHRFCVFFTLTYNEKNVPYYVLESDRYNSYLANTFDLHSNGYPTLQYDINGLANRYKWTDWDLSYINSIDRLAYVSKRDVQLFMKRLRSQINYKYNEKVRYFICSEYGPKTFRPHYHGLLFFDSREVQQNIYTLLRESWSLGFVNCSLANGRALGYVAKYVTGFSHYPKIYEVKEFRPFALYSKRPAIGTPEINKETLPKLLMDANSGTQLAVDNTIKYVPYPRSLVNRLFPKCREFSKKSLVGRATDYGLYKNYEKQAKDLGCTALDVVKHEIMISERKDTSIMHDFYVSKQVCTNASLLNTSVYEYAKIIDKYYKDRELQALSKFYAFQEELSETQPMDMKYIINLYPDFHAQILDFENRKYRLKWFDLKMKSLGYLYDDYKECGMISTDKLRALDFRNSTTFKRFVAETENYEYLNNKTKVLNDKTVFKNNINHLQLNLQL